MPVKDKSSKVSLYSAKIPYTKENLRNIVGVVTEATTKLSQIV